MRLITVLLIFFNSAVIADRIIESFEIEFHMAWDFAPPPDLNYEALLGYSIEVDGLEAEFFPSHFFSETNSSVFINQDNFSGSLNQFSTISVELLWGYNPNTGEYNYEDAESLRSEWSSDLIYDYYPSYNDVRWEGFVISAFASNEFNGDGSYYIGYSIEGLGSYSNIPEPSTVAFLGLSTMGLYGYRRRERILGNFGAIDILNYKPESKRSLRWRYKSR